MLLFLSFGAAQREEGGGRKEEKSSSFRKSRYSLTFAAHRPLPAGERGRKKEEETFSTSPSCHLVPHDKRGGRKYLC